MTIQKIYEDHHITCCFQNGQRNNSLIFTFGGMFSRPNNSLFLWSGEPIKKIGYPAFGFTAKAQNWYPAASVLKAIQLIKSHPQYQTENKVGYGYSMGAYAVLKYGDALSLSSVLSLSPQFSIDPFDIKDPRFNRHFNPENNKDMKVAEGDYSGKAFLIVDQYSKRDYEHALRISSALLVDLIHSPNFGHGLINAFRGTEILSDLLFCCINNDLREIKGIVSKRRRFASARPVGIANRLAPNHPNLALAVFAKYQEHFTGRDLEIFIRRFSSPHLAERAIVEIRGAI
ncbi:hypothetical protein [Marinobacter sp. ATCH36]|uniref:hypothetical protein n=1 Tax=Marinobacter sp. ATCH36 TaxID=2945106 RepID=UPI00202293C0|nr:hypothetical protein [Marinobacter sp. ATCH36]MCL7945139.1 hypothetical protein [Marinobacter sp. ATCH36]